MIQAELKGSMIFLSADKESAIYIQRLRGAFRTSKMPPLTWALPLTYDAIDDLRREKVLCSPQLAQRAKAMIAARKYVDEQKTADKVEPIGDDLNPTINNLIDGATGLLEKFMALDESQRMQIIQFAAIAAAAGPVISILGKVTTTVGKGATLIGKFATAVGNAGGGWSGFISVLGKSPATWFAVAAAVAYGTYKLIDYASGAKAAREALEGMEETAENWKNTAADTFYGNSEGLSFFGMSTEDFKKSGTDIAQSGADWPSGLLTVWTDGKKETNAIVKEWTDSFKAGTEEIRTALSDLKVSADESGYTGLSAQMEEDLKSLDSMDTEISKLLKKRQSKLFTDNDKIRLQELIDAREAIQVKYNLVPDTGNTAGFDSIRDKVEAEVSRAAALGKEDADISVYENAIVGAAQGMAEINQQIDDNYDKEFALIQMIDDSAEREAALADLNRRYAVERTDAAQEYAKSLKELVMPVWEQDSIQKAAEDMGKLSSVLSEYSTLGVEGRKGMLGTLDDLTASLDESALTEYISLLVQIQSLMDSGMSEAEVQAMFPEIDFSGSLEQLAAIQKMLNDNQWDTNLDSLSSMFGEALPEEVLKIATDLDMTGAQERWNEFAANPGAITADAIITSKVAITGYDTAAYNSFLENNPVTVQGIVRLGDTEYGDNPSGAVNGENIKFYGLDGIEIPVSAVPTELLDASTLCVLDEDGTLHVMVTPEITGTPEAIGVAREMLEADKSYSLAPDIGATIDLSTFEIIGMEITALKGLLNTLETDSINDLWGLLDGLSKKSQENYIKNTFDPEMIEGISVYVQEMVAAIQNGGAMSVPRILRTLIPSLRC